MAFAADGLETGHIGPRVASLGDLMERLSLNVAGERRVLRMILVRPKNRGGRAAGPGANQFEARLRRAVIPTRFTHSSQLKAHLRQGAR